MPAYKRRFLREAVASVLAQTFRDFELVVVDDGSPEDLKGVIDSFDDPRLTYHRNQPNIGGKDLVAAWNHAMTFAHGEWCVLASDDDVYEPRYLETLLTLSERHPECDLIHCRVKLIDASGTETGISEVRNEVESCLEMMYNRSVRRFRQMAPEFMFRREAFRRIGGFVRFPLAWYSDDATWIRLADKGVAFAAEPLFSFRQSGENISTRLDLCEGKLAAAREFTDWAESFVRGLQVDGQDRELKERILRELRPVVRGCMRYVMSEASLRIWMTVMADFRLPIGLRLRFLKDRVLGIRK